MVSDEYKIAFAALQSILFSVYWKETRHEPDAFQSYILIYILRIRSDGSFVWNVGMWTDLFLTICESISVFDS